jgi:hypothetical protein
MNIDGSKQLDEKTRSDISQLKEQLGTQVDVFYNTYIDLNSYLNAVFMVV